MCGGNSSCVGCDGIAFSGKSFDACHVCAGNNSTCTGCDNVLYSNKTYDSCGVCAGNNSTCWGCDHIANSNKVYDNCGVCGGNGDSCASSSAAIATPSSSNKKSNNIPLIAGVAGGGGLLLIVAIIVVIVIIKRKNSRVVETIPMTENYAPISVHSTNYESMNRNSLPEKQVVRRSQVVLPAIKYEIDYAELVLDSPLGEGYREISMKFLRKYRSFGTVYKGTWRSSPVAGNWVFRTI